MGPQLLRPDGTVFAAGATGHTAVFTPGEEDLDASPGFSQPERNESGQYTAGDSPPPCSPVARCWSWRAPASIINHPRISFCSTAPTLQQIPDPRNAANLSSYYGYMIVLPTGQVMFNSRLGDIELYTDTGAIGGPAQASHDHLGSHDCSSPGDELSPAPADS